MTDKQSKADTFVADILEAHTNYLNSSKRGFRYALDCGKLLNLAQEDLLETKGEGHWLAWLKDKTGIPQTTANLYQRLATNRHLFLDDNDQVLETGEVGKLAKDGELSLRAAAEFLPKRTRAASKKSTPATATTTPPSTPAPTTSDAAASPTSGTVEAPTNVVNLPAPDLETVLANRSEPEICIALCRRMEIEDLFKLASGIVQHVLGRNDITPEQWQLYKKGLVAILEAAKTPQAPAEHQEPLRRTGT